MGILGNLKLRRRSKEVIVGTDDAGEAVTLTVYPPGLGVIDKLDGEVHKPVAPLAKDSAGRTVKVLDDAGKPLIDQATGSAMLARNYKDAAYGIALETREKVLTIGLILHCLGDAVTPTKDLEDHDGDMVAYYLSAWAELEAAGLDIGSYRALSAACTKLSLPLGERDVQLAKEALAVDDTSQAEIKAAAKAEGKGKLKGK